VSSGVGACPRCGGVVARSQEYCVECGIRLPGGGPVGLSVDPARDWFRRSLVGLAVAAAGAAAAVAASGGGGAGGALLTATGGFATVRSTGTLPSPPRSTSRGVAGWPSGQEGWTIVLASYPQTRGRKLAVSRARDARARGLPQVGILDSSAYASLHPGYWIVFTGIYSSEAEAASALQPARDYTRTAGIRRVVQ
jgi:hypothetical protein